MSSKGTACIGELSSAEFLRGKIERGQHFFSSTMQNAVSMYFGRLAHHRQRSVANFGRLYTRKDINRLTKRPSPCLLAMSEERATCLCTSAFPVRMPPSDRSYLHIHHVTNRKCEAMLNKSMAVSHVWGATELKISPLVQAIKEIHVDCTFYFWRAEGCSELLLNTLNHSSNGFLK